MVGFIKDTSKIKMILHRKSFNNFDTLWLPHIKVLKIFSFGRFLQNACDHVFLSNTPSLPLLLEAALPFSPRFAAVCCRCCRVSRGTPTEKYSWTSPTAADLETILTLAKLLWFLLSVAKQLSNFRDYIIVKGARRPFTKCACHPYLTSSTRTRDGSNCCAWGSSTRWVWAASWDSPTSRGTVNRSGKRTEYIIPDFNLCDPFN